MQIGIVPVLGGQNGGIYQYSYNILTALYYLETDDRFILFTEDEAPLGFLGDERPGWRIRPIEPYSMRSILLKYLRRVAKRPPHQKTWDVALPRKYVEEFEDEEEEEVFDPDVINYRPERGRWFARCGADIMIYPAPSVLSFEAGIPYVVALHDLKYPLHAEYPQLLRAGEAEGYEYMIRNAARYAALILVDSETAKEDVLQHCGSFGVAENSVRVLPLVPPAYLDLEITEEETQRVLVKFGVSEPYLFLPADFWPHKNHDFLVEALDLLRSEYKLAVPAVLCGSAAGRVREERYRQILNLIHDRELEGQVRYLGRVADDEMSAFYSGARLVADLTRFGTSSFAVQEAWAFGRPVIASRIRGIRRQVEDAGMLVDPKSVEEAAEAIRKLWTEPATRAELVERGRMRHQAFTLADLSGGLAGILKEAQARMESREES